MKVEFHLRRRTESGPTGGFWVPGLECARLLEACARLGLDPSGRVFALEGGFLITLDRPPERPLPGLVRLRALAPDLYLPADADLVPTLLDDEARGLVRDRGLVFLPWGPVLGYDPRGPLDVSALLLVELRPRRDWRPLPERPPLADRIEEIGMIRPDESPDELLEAGGGEIGTEEPLPREDGAAAKLAGGAWLGAGRGMAWLGRTFGLPGLARLGAEWAGKAIDRVPSLGEAVLGRQGAALRALLKEFREGDVERALRRALPLGEPGGARGAGVAAGDQLPLQDLSYSLGGILNPANRKPTSLWLGGRDVLDELTREYRKAAEQALLVGDFRRSAFIYGKLLRDYRMAAHALAKGGLHHDAAIILLRKVDDPRGAARAFEAAGEIEQAIRLYRGVGDHEAAGDLLRRVGEEDAAVAEYRTAAEALVASRAGHLAAGNLLATKAGRRDLALEQYRKGWSLRPEPNALGCAIAALSVLADGGPSREFTTLLEEAGGFVDASGLVSESALYFNFVAGLAGRDELAGAREELRDRALMGLATTLRRQARPGVATGRLVSHLLGQPRAWPAALVGDADFAARAAARLPIPRPRAEPPANAVRRSRIGEGVVSAVAAASTSGEVFVGFEGGDVLGFRPERSEVVRVASYDLPVAALGVSPDGRSVVVLRAGSSKLGALSSYARAPDGSYRLRLGMTIDGVERPWLTPVLSGGTEDLVALWDGHDLFFLTAASLTSRGSLSLARPDADPRGALLFPGEEASDRGFGVFVNDGREWSLLGASGDTRHPSGFVWRPCSRDQDPLRSIPLSWLRGEPGQLEVAGLGGFGSLQWAAFRCGPGRIDLEASNAAAQEGGYLAATLVRPRRVAGVTRSRIEWLRCGASAFTPASVTELALPSAVACFACRRTNELIVVCHDGFVARVPIPI